MKAVNIPEGNDQLRPLDILGMLKIVWYGKWVITASVLLLMALGTYYALHLTGPLYAATATVQIERQTPIVAEAAGQNRTDPASINTQISHITSAPLLSAVISELGLLRDPEFNRYLTPASPISPNQIRRTLRNLLAGTSSTTPDERDILLKTIENLRGRLSTERQEDTYLFRITARSRDPDKAMQLANVTAQTFINENNDIQSDEARTRVDWLNSRVATLRAQLSRQDRAVIDLIQTVQVHEDTALDRLSTAVLALEQEHSELQTTLIAFEADPSPTTARRAAQLGQLRAQIAETQARHDRLQLQLSTQSAGMLALQHMQREADATRALHQSFNARLQEAKIQNALIQSESRIVTPATAGNYVGMRKTLIVNISAVVGLLAGLLAVSLQHVLRRGVYHPHQLAQETGGVVLSQIPARLTGRPSIFRRQLEDKTTSKLLPKLRQIRAGLMLQNAGSLPQVIMVTASGNDEGIAPLAIGLAEYLARLCGPCSLVVADTMNAELRALLPSDQRFTSAQGSATGNTAFDVTYLDGPESLIGPDIQLKIAALRDNSKHIILLAPPVINTPETLICGREADAVIYAVRWATRPAATIRNGLRLLAHSCNAPIGLVLTKTQPRKMQRMVSIAGLPDAEMNPA